MNYYPLLVAVAFCIFYNKVGDIENVRGKILPLGSILISVISLLVLSANIIIMIVLQIGYGVGFSMYHIACANKR